TTMPPPPPASRKPPTIPRGQPLDTVSLRAVLGGQKTPAFANRTSSGEPEIYEIPIDEEEVLDEVLDLPGVVPGDDWAPVPLAVEPSVNRVDQKQLDRMVARAEEKLRESAKVPKIPLFSSLSTPRLLQLIQKVEVRDV